MQLSNEHSELASLERVLITARTDIYAKQSFELSTDESLPCTEWRGKKDKTARTCQSTSAFQHDSLNSYKLVQIMFLTNHRNNLDKKKFFMTNLKRLTRGCIKTDQRPCCNATRSPSDIPHIQQGAH
jgi:hypothetical protein